MLDLGCPSCAAEKFALGETATSHQLVAVTRTNNGENTMRDLITLIAHVARRIAEPRSGESWGGGNKPPGC
jgi:hypothetical protein